MGNTDSLPVISQAKSTVQLIAGDEDGAIETQKNFIKGCPVVSQVVATIAVIYGDSEYAKQSQLYFVKGISDAADAIPVVGHVKGGVHYLVGDKEGGNNAMKAASRTAGVVGGGVGGCILAGPFGAAAGGVTGGAAMDAIISAADSAVHGQKRLYGLCQAVDQARNGRMSVGERFDWCVTITFDGLTGYRAGRAVKNFSANRAAQAQLKGEIIEAIREGKIEILGADSVDALFRELQNAACQMKEVLKSGADSVKGTKCTIIIDMEGNVYTGYSFRLRKALSLDPFQGEEASTQQVLSEKYPGGRPKIRGAAAGEPSCSEHHALHEFHKAQGNVHAVPNRMITIDYDGVQFRAVARCGNCKKIGNYIPMGDVVTDNVDGAPVPLNDAMKKAVVDAILVEVLNLCNCESSSELKDDEDKDK